MAIPASGPLSMSMFNTELGRTATQANSLLAGGTVPTTGSLFWLANQSGSLDQTAPHSMSEWYNYTAGSYPTFQSAGTATGVSATGNIFIDYPLTGSLVNDLYVLTVSVRNTTTTVTTPNGFTLINGPAQGGTTVRHYNFYRRANGTEASSGSVTASFGADAAVTKIGRIVRYSNVITTGTPYEGLTSASAATSATATQPSIATTGSNRLIVIIATSADDNTFTDFSGGTGPTPGPFAENAYFSTTAGSDGALEHQSARQAAAATVSGNTSSLAGGGGGADDYVLTSFALIPP